MNAAVVNIRASETEYDTCIMRPTKWGNPSKISNGTSRSAAIENFAKHLFISGLIEDIGELRGKVLGCCCKPLPCHGDVLVFWANKSPGEVALAVEYYRTYNKFPFRAAVQVVISDCASRSVRYGQEFHWVPGDQGLCCFSTIFQKNNLTEKQKSVTSVIPARDGHNNQTVRNHMNLKHLALIAGILSTAFAQIKNVLCGSPSDDADDTPVAPKKPAGKKPAVEPEPEEDDTDTDPTVHVEDDDTPDVDDLRKKAKALVSKLFTADESNKSKVRKLLNTFGEGTALNDLEDDDVPKFYDKLKKIK